MLYVMFGVPPLITSLVRLILLLTCFNFETPMFYVLKRDNKNALKVLGQMYVEDKVQE